MINFIDAACFNITRLFQFKLHSILSNNLIKDYLLI